MPTTCQSGNDTKKNKKPNKSQQTKAKFPSWWVSWNNLQLWIHFFRLHWVHRTSYFVFQFLVSLHLQCPKAPCRGFQFLALGEIGRSATAWVILRFLQSFMGVQAININIYRKYPYIWKTFKHVVLWKW